MAHIFTNDIFLFPSFLVFEWLPWRFINVLLAKIRNEKERNDKAELVIGVLPQANTSSCIGMLHLWPLIAGVLIFFSLFRVLYNSFEAIRSVFLPFRS